MDTKLDVNESLNSLQTLQRKSYSVVFDLEGTDYESVMNIGSGTYGVVCSAVHRLSGCKVAIKKVHNIFENVTLARRTYREMKILRHFQHENIIRIHEILRPRLYDFCDVYLVFDLMESDLHQVIHSKQELTDEHIRYFLYQILCGLNYIHSANVIHRDLKPSNILVNENCDLKIGDFGMARAVKFADSDYQNHSLLMTWYVMTRWYRAPELLLFQCQYTAAVDVWSVGCIFAEMLGRHVTFPGKDLLHQLMLIVNVLGSPTDQFISLAHSERVKNFLQRMDSKAALSPKMLFPKAHPKALKLLEKMLRWHPCERIRVDAALHDLYLNNYCNPADVLVCKSSITFAFDEEQITDVNQLRKMIYAEIMSQDVDSDSSVCCNTYSSSAADEYKKTAVSQLASSTVQPTDDSSTGPRLPMHTSVTFSAPHKKASSTPAKAKRQYHQKAIYQRILPATSIKPAELARGSAQQHQSLTAKEILRAAILHGRNNSHIKAKHCRGKNKGQKLNSHASQESQVCLTHEDQILLDRWKCMQKCAADMQQCARDVCHLENQVVEDSIENNTASTTTTASTASGLYVEHKHQLNAGVAGTCSEADVIHVAADSGDVHLIDACLSEMCPTPAIDMLDYSPPATTVAAAAGGQQLNDAVMLSDTAAATSITLQLTLSAAVSATGYGLGSVCSTEMLSLSADMNLYESLDEMLFGSHQLKD